MSLLIDSPDDILKDSDYKETIKGMYLWIYVIVSYEKCITIIIKMSSYNCDVNSYFLIAVDFSHKTLTSIICS